MIYINFHKPPFATNNIKSNTGYPILERQRQKLPTTQKLIRLSLKSTSIYIACKV